MKKFIVLIACALFLLADADAINIKLLSSNKEAHSRILSQGEINSTEAWIREYGDEEVLQKKLLEILTNSIEAIEKNGRFCELGLIQFFEKHLIDERIIENSEELPQILNYLRLRNFIDDIFLEILKKSARIQESFKSMENTSPPMRPINLNTRNNVGIHLNDFFSQFKKWPDEKKECSLDAYWEMVTNLNYKNNRDRDLQILKLNYLAFKDGVIDLKIFNRLEILRKKGVLDWPVYLKRYFDIISNLKDKLSTSPENSTSNTFTIEYVSRRNGITAREALYQNYSSTELMLLAQIIERTAKRMDARRATIHWQYSNSPEDEEIYVLSPMEQYRATLKMLKKEMAEVMRSEIFKNKNVEYEHIIGAAFEAGFIRTEELNYVLRFEDFWNPKTPKWKAYFNFVSSFAGTAVFYLPPPWNLVGAIGLLLTQTKIANGNKKPDPDDNWNVII